MEIEGTRFGSITIDRKTYEHDVVIRLSGEVIKRKKKLSKKYYGTSHVLSKDEAKFVFEKGCEQFIIGSGQLAMCIYRQKLKPILQKRAARSCCSLRPRRYECSTNHMQRRLDFFTLPVENNAFRSKFFPNREHWFHRTIPGASDATTGLGRAGA